ncbi:uncharacterized protein LOC123309261 isoform X1 [Coccinella septempunctata]|uniref:uncharacterized protein LOC123309261 isoform X1 n=1 Tax=Coccinella septempunctata TaxID=41139 RepID=UPI001D07500A|nr:uncharacterized protein LOC123309261 isoform X1 [Coccinella septempunctata]
MGKSKHKRDSSSDSSSERSSSKRLLKRIKQLEKRLDDRRRDKDGKRKHRSRSLSRAEKGIRSRAENGSTDRSLSRAEKLRRVERDEHLEQRRHSKSPSRVSRRFRADSTDNFATTPPIEVGSVDAYSVTEPTDDVLDLNTDEDTLEEELSENILHILGNNDRNKNLETQFGLHGAIAPVWENILVKGFKKEEIENLLQRYEMPNNLTLLAPPKLNNEITAILSKTNVARDGSYTEIQHQVGKGLCALGKGMNLILANRENIPEEYKTTLLTYLSDSSRILANVFHRVSVTRRNLIAPLVNKTIRDLVVKSNPGEYLFGADLSETIKTAKNLETISRDLRLQNSFESRRSQNKGGESTKYKPNPTKNTLNYRRPVRLLEETRQKKGQSSRPQRWENQKQEPRKHQNDYWKNRR